MLYATFLLYKFPEQKLYEKFPVMELVRLVRTCKNILQELFQW